MDHREYFSTFHTLRYMPVSAHARLKICSVLLGSSMLLSSCYTYRLATHAQPATDTYGKPIRANSYLWGLLNKPQVLHTPACDQLGVNGVAEVTVKTNFGFALITIATLGIYCPLHIYYKCSKPCQQTDSL